MSLVLLAAFGVIAAIHIATLGLATCRLRAARGKQPPPRHLPPVSIVRPVCGIEHRLEAALTSGFQLDYPNFEIVFCVEEADDAAIPLLHHLIGEHSQVPARLLIGDERIGINPKLNNVVKGYHAARHDFLMMVDSNVLMPQHCIQRVLGEWRDDTGVISAPGIGSAPEGLAGEIECAFLNTYQARWLLAGDRLGLGYAQGKMMLFKRSDLERSGGISALAQEVAEDSGLTKAMRRLGRMVRMSDVAFFHPVGRRRFAGMWGRQLRWAKLRRACFPVVYALEIAACPLVPIAIFAAVAAIWGLSPAWIGLFAATLYAGEALLAAVAGWRLTPLSPVFWIVRDILALPLWLLGWTGSSFEWRGHAMKIGDDNPDAAAAKILRTSRAEVDTARQ